MFIPFDQLSDDARIWIYQADRDFSEAEIKSISKSLGAFCHQWVAHQHPLHSSFHIAYHRFIILAVDEAHHGASGCSIDSSVAVVRQLEQVLGVNLFNRMDVAFIVRGALGSKNLSQFKKDLAAGLIDPSTGIFNNLVDRKSRLDSDWLMPLGQSWLAKFIPADKNLV